MHKVVVMKVIKQNGNAYHTVLYLAFLPLLWLIKYKNLCTHLSSDRMDGLSNSFICWIW